MRSSSSRITRTKRSLSSALAYFAVMLNTGCIVPLYYYTDIFMIDDSVQGFFSNPLGYKYFMHCTIAK